MKLLTKAIEKSLPPLNSTEDIPIPERVVHCKFFDPSSSYTLYVLEGETEGDDFTFFGYVTGLVEDELGYTSLRELESVRGRFGLGIERDLYWTPKPVKDVPALSELVKKWEV